MGPHGLRQIGKGNPGHKPRNKDKATVAGADLQRPPDCLHHCGTDRIDSGSHSASSGNQISTKHIRTMIANIGSAALAI